MEDENLRAAVDAAFAHLDYRQRIFRSKGLYAVVLVRQKEIEEGNLRQIEARMGGVDLIGQDG